MPGQEFEEWSGGLDGLHSHAHVMKGMGRGHIRAPSESGVIPYTLERIDAGPETPIGPRPKRILERSGDTEKEAE